MAQHKGANIRYKKNSLALSFSHPLRKHYNGEHCFLKIPPFLSPLHQFLFFWCSEMENPSRAEAFPVGLRVLVVDDDPTWLKIIERMLKKCSYEGSFGSITNGYFLIFLPWTWVC